MNPPMERLYYRGEYRDSWPAVISDFPKSPRLGATSPPAHSVRQRCISIPSIKNFDITHKLFRFVRAANSQYAISSL